MLFIPNRVQMQTIIFKPKITFFKKKRSTHTEFMIITNFIEKVNLKFVT